MWVTKLLISPVKKRIFCPKTTIWPKIGIFGQFGPGHAGLFGALLVVVWWLWRAGCISQDTYLLYYHPNCQYHFFLLSQWQWETQCSSAPRILFRLFHLLFLFRWLWKIFEDIVFGSTLALLSTLRAVKTSTSNPHTATGLTLLPLFYFSFLSYHLFSIYLLSLFL